jgi:hypothetical protein
VLRPEAEEVGVAPGGRLRFGDALEDLTEQETAGDDEDDKPCNGSPRVGSGGAGRND